MPDSQKIAHSPLLFALPTHGSSSHRAGIKRGTFHRCGEGILRYTCDPREIQGINEQPPLIPRCSHISLGMDSTKSDNFMQQGHLSKGEATQGLFQLFRVEEKKRKGERTSERDETLQNSPHCSKTTPHGLSVPAPPEPASLWDAKRTVSLALPEERRDS